MGDAKAAAAVVAGNAASHYYGSAKGLFEDFWVVALVQQMARKDYDRLWAPCRLFATHNAFKIQLHDPERRWLRTGFAWVVRWNTFLGLPGPELG